MKISVCYITVKSLLFLYSILSISNNLKKSNVIYWLTIILFKCKGPDDGGKNSGATIRANHPIPLQCKLFYFEVEIIDKGKNGYVGFISFFVLHRINIFNIYSSFI